MKLTCTQLSLLFESVNLLKEDFDKVVGLVKNLVQDFNKSLSRTPADEQQKLFHLVNYLTKIQADLNPDELGLFYNLLGNYYQLNPEQLKQSYDAKLAEMEAERERQAEAHRSYSTADWLRDYARHQGMNVKGPSKPEVKSDESESDFKSKLDSMSNNVDYMDNIRSQLERLQPYFHESDFLARVRVNFERMSIGGWFDLLTFTPDDYLKQRNFGFMVLHGLVQNIKDNLIPQIPKSSKYRELRNYTHTWIDYAEEMYRSFKKRVSGRNFNSGIGLGDRVDGDKLGTGRIIDVDLNGRPRTHWVAWDNPKDQASAYTWEDPKTLKKIS